MSDFHDKPPMKKRCTIYSSDEEDVVECVVDVADQMDIFDFTDCEEMSNIQHFPVRLEKRLRCRICASHKRRTATYYACDICKTNSGQSIGLCVDKCFKMYHTQCREEGNDDEDDNTDWIQTDMDPVLHNFTGPEGLKAKLSPSSSTFDVFALLFDDALVGKILHWTNTTAELLLSTTYVASNSILNMWTPVTIVEMNKFLALCIVIGNIHMPSIRAYWSSNILYNHPLFEKTMSRNRFESILYCLRFYDETTADKTNHLHKIDHLLNHILENIQNIYYPGVNLSIDDSFNLWKGRLLLKQCMPLKETKYGINIYKLTANDGFILNIMFNYGKNIDNNVSNIVHNLLNNYLGNGHTVFMGNYFNSVQLAQTLYGEKTHVAGTLRSDRRGIPAFVIDKILKKDESIFARKGNILVQKWKDKREILTISTKHKATLQKVMSKNGLEKSKPITIVDYNRNMSINTGRTDQIVNYFSSPPKLLPIFMKLFFHLFDVTIWNACCLYNKLHPSKLDYLEFRNDLALILLSSNTELVMIPESNNSNVQHFPLKLEKRLRCRICASYKRRTATFYACDICKTNSGQPIGLCVDKCFKMYHIK